ncbi:MAG: winged helix-turn-helix domain-containing protein [Enterobacteriaceae bacterium]|jgi:DNA-binding winged helix-turn-helix (wHTH) protein|nr:winged helix-turn-helix domain-containing protein [Enterobacteriaceae bacterium]
MKKITRKNNKFGYYVNSDDVCLSVDLINSVIVNINTNEIIQLRETMMRLFVYLLENANGLIVSNKTIMSNVWDVYELKSSNQRLWQVMQLLLNKLSSIHVPYDFIEHVDTKGYRIKQTNIVHLFYDEENMSQEMLLEAV